MDRPKRRNVPMETMDKAAAKIFDSSKQLSALEPHYNKHKTFVLYTIFGAGTVLVSMFTYWFLTEKMHWYYLIGNIVSWLFATTFAFFTNRKWVFTKRARGVFAFFWQFGGFYFGRVITLFIEEWILLFFVGVMHWPNMIVKTVAQIIVITLNWVISKLVVFRNRIPVKKIHIKK